MSSKDLVLKEENAGAAPPSVALVPMMYAHLLLTGDWSQHKAWRERSEKIEQQNELAETTDPGERALIARPEVWREVRRMSWWATNFTLLYCAVETAKLISDYATGFGFGWAAAGTYALPIPIAWMIGRRLFQQGSVGVMKYLGPNPSGSKQAKSWFRAMAASFTAGFGFGFGFALTFLQGLISYFMTPAPTIWLELWMDVTNAFWAALPAGLVSSVMWPLLCRRAPSGHELPEGEVRAALPAANP